MDNITEQGKKSDDSLPKKPSNDNVEWLRSLILRCRKRYMTFVEIGKIVGLSEDYIESILNYKFFPKRAEYQNKLLEKFERLREFLEKQND